MAKMTSGMRMLAMAKAQSRGNGGGYMGDMPEMRRSRDSRGRYMQGEGMRYIEDRERMERPERMEQTERMEQRTRRGMHMPPNYDGQDPYSGETDSWPERKMPAMKGGTYSYRRADGGEGKISYFQGHKADPLKQEKPERKMQQMGFMQQDKGHESKFDKQTAMEWVESMEDASGVKGGAYTWHQAQQYGRNMGITGEERLVEFYATMNAMQSDYWQVAKKFGVDKPEFYACMAKAFIEDPDAVDDKVAMYYECIARKA